MNPISRPFMLPLTFKNLANIRDRQLPTEQDVLEYDLSQTEAVSLVSWGLAEQQQCESTGVEDGAAIPSTSRGAVIGCKDGTLYIFHVPSNVPASQPTSIAIDTNLSRPSTGVRVSRLIRDSSRPNSPAPSLHNHTPFNVSSRSRIVSGINLEKIEAPKNYVDYQEEPEKLKEMLKGKVLKERNHQDDASSISSDKQPAEEASTHLSVTSGAESYPGPSKPQSNPKSLLSATNSPVFAVKSISRPISLKSGPPTTPAVSHDLSLRYHVLPPRSGFGKPISGLEIIRQNSLVVALQEPGDLSVFKIKDGSCLATCHAGQAPGTKNPDTSGEWVWSYLQTFDMGESTMILASGMASTPPSLSSIPHEVGSEGRARVVLFELVAGDEFSLVDLKLERVWDWAFDGPPEGAGIQWESGDILTFFYVDMKGHFITQKLKLLPTTQAAPLDPEPHVSTSVLPLSNPFKPAAKNRSVEHLSNLNQSTSSRIAFEEEHEYDNGAVLSDTSPLGLRTRLVEGRIRGITWTDRELSLFISGPEKSLQVLFTIPMVEVTTATWIEDDSFSVIFADRAEFYKVIPVDGNNDVLIGGAGGTAMNFRPRLLQSIPNSSLEAVDPISASELATTQVDSNGRRVLAVLSHSSEPKQPSAKVELKTRTVWASADRGANGSSSLSLTSMLPLELDLIVLGYSDGYIQLSSIAEMTGQPSKPDSPRKVSDIPLDGYITGLHDVQNTRTKERFIVGGADDGSVAFWSREQLKLCARWIAFSTPLCHVLQFLDDKTGPLRNCVLCIAQDSTIAVVVADGFQFLYLIPGSASPLQRLCLGGDSLLLVYSDYRARMWDIKMKEFRRSMTLDKAEELLGQDGWLQLPLDAGICLPNMFLKARLNAAHRGSNSASTLYLDLEQYLAETATMAKSVSVPRDRKRAALDNLRSILSTQVTPGLNENIDKICFEKLRLTAPAVLAGSVSLDSSSLFNTKSSQDSWCISPECSASRALLITALLRVLGTFEESSEDTNTVTTFYASSLPQVVGTSYQPPSLVYLAKRWFDASNELRQASQIIFDAAVPRLSDEEAGTLLEFWQCQLPCLQPIADKESMPAALALYLCGYIAAEKYSLLPTSLLTDVAKSVAIYLHDEQSVHRVLAIDLCSRGFQIWQHYVDAMEILRALYTLATNSRKEAITAQNVAAQARLAVLQIASSNTPLFMTTLGLDILHPGSVEHRKSVMQIVAFLIRKRPLVLYPNLPRLMEAVVKSLDPNSTASRDAVLDTATEILGHVVKTFPSVDFHMASQRLAVGTSEGAIVMYDLKTATRLYVLEGHQKRISACSFSPDGRRLVTVSLEESVVLVWKVGSSFSSFFHPGAPPRQGHAGSEPYKTLSFNVGNEADMTLAGTLEWLQFEWPAERSVKLQIRESVLTFST